MLRVTSFIQSSITSLCDRSAIYGYLNNKKKQEKTANSRKKLSEKIVEGIKK